MGSQGYGTCCPAPICTLISGKNSCVPLVDPFASESLEASPSIQHLLCESQGSATSDSSSGRSGTKPRTPAPSPQSTKLLLRPQGPKGVPIIAP